MTEITEDNNLGMLVSKTLTLQGFGFALLDVMIMGIDLVATIYLVRLFAAYGQINLESVTILAVSLFFLERWMRDWLRVTHPDGHYEYRRTFVKDGVTKVITSVHLWEDN